MSLVPPGSAESFVDLDGGRVRVLRSDAEPDPRTTRPPMLLIHGGGSDNSAISWYQLYAALGAEREVLGVDLPGFGRTTGIEPVGGPAELADFVARAARALALPRAVVTGVSMGGDVALNLALHHPDLVEALVLIAPGGLIPVLRNRVAQLAAWMTAALPDQLLIPLTRLANRNVRTVIAAMVTDPDTVPPEAFDEFVREARRPRTGQGYLRYNQASLGPWSMRNNLLPVVSQIEAPTLLFHGRDDPMVDPEGSQRASELMPHARLVMVDECGHWAQLEAGARFLTELRAFLADIEAGTL